MPFNIVLDYRFDSRGFFNDPARRAAMERAAEIWEGIIRDDFDPVPVGTTFSIDDPSNGGTDRTITLDAPIDDLLIFIGAEPLSGPLGFGGYDGTDARGDVFRARVARDFRGDGPVTDFEPWVGTITFNTTSNFGYALDAPEPGKADFLTTALHEIGHVLGVGTAPAFDALISGTAFTGPNARAENGGTNIPLDPGLGHVADGFDGDTVLMDPITINGTRKLPTDLDLAILADIGYQVDGFTAQGSTPPIATEGDDRPIFGTDLADLIDGLGGADQIQGSAGDDTLLGGAGDDTLFGQDGNDRLVGGPGSDGMQGGAGDDTLVGGQGTAQMFGQSGTDSFEIVAGGGSVQVNDFDLSGETLLLSGSGFASAADAVAAIQKPFSNVSRISFGDGTFVDVFHTSQSGTPLTTDHVQLLQATDDRLLIGTSGNDVLGGGAGNDTLRGLDGADTLIGGAGDDLIEGGDSAADLRDVVYGGDGNDTIDGGYGNDELRGDAGNDSIAGGFGADTVIGGAGNDTLTGSAFGDLIFGGDGFDFVNGGFGSDRVNGGSGGDRFFHLGVADHGSDWIQDYNAAEGDILVFGGSATRDQFQINVTNTANAGSDGVDEAFVIYRPTGQILWALVDGDGQDQINLSLGGQMFDLTA